MPMQPKSILKGALCVVAVALAAACSGNGGGQFGRATEAQNEPDGTSSKEVCPHIPGLMHCDARVKTDLKGNLIVHNAATISGFGPADLASAYALPSGGGAGQTIGIVDAQDAPNAEADLGTYRAQFGLPPCTTANGCFRKVNQQGQASPLPTPDSGWAQEIAL